MAKKKKVEEKAAGAQEPAPTAPAQPKEKGSEGEAEQPKKGFKLPAGLRLDGKTFISVPVDGGAVVVNPRGIPVSPVDKPLSPAEAGKLANDFNLKARRNKLDF